jgi:hypothetical protein
VIAAAGAAAAIAIGAATVSVATGGDDQPLEGDDLARATQAALASTDGGTVVESEHGDDGTGFEVVVRLDDGRLIEVTLDDVFRVVDATPDDEEGGSTDDEA